MYEIPTPRAYQNAYLVMVLIKTTNVVGDIFFSKTPLELESFAIFFATGLSFSWSRSWFL